MKYRLSFYHADMNESMEVIETDNLAELMYAAINDALCRDNQISQLEGSGSCYRLATINEEDIRIAY